MTRRKAVPAPATEPFVLRDGHALVLRTCAADLTSYNGFKWPKAGPVECPEQTACAPRPVEHPALDADGQMTPGILAEMSGGVR